MWEQIKLVIKNILTGIDNQTYDLGRISWAINNVALIGFVIFNSYKEGHVNITEFAGAVSVIVAAHSVSLFVKKTTEPTNSN